MKISKTHQAWLSAGVFALLALHGYAETEVVAGDWLVGLRNYKLEIYLGDVLVIGGDSVCLSPDASKANYLKDLCSYAPVGTNQEKVEKRGDTQVIVSVQKSNGMELHRTLTVTPDVIKGEYTLIYTTNITVGAKQSNSVWLTIPLSTYYRQIPPLGNVFLAYGIDCLKWSNKGYAFDIRLTQTVACDPEGKKQLLWKLKDRRPEKMEYVSLVVQPIPLKAGGKATIAFEIRATPQETK